MSRNKKNPTAMFYLARMGDTTEMDPRELGSIQRKCIFDDFHRAEVALGKPNNFLGNGVICFRDHFRFGLRFPLCPELVTILCYYNIVPAQIFPASMGQIMVVISFLRRCRLKWSMTLFCHLFEYSINGYGIFRFFSSQLVFSNLPGPSLDWMSKYLAVIRDSAWPISTIPSENCPPMYLREPRTMNVEERDSFYHIGEFPLDFNDLVSWADCCDIGMTYRDFRSSYPSPMNFDEPQEETRTPFYGDYSGGEANAGESSSRPTTNFYDNPSPVFVASPAGESDYSDGPVDSARIRDRCVRFNRNRSEARVNMRIDPLDTGCFGDTCAFDLGPVISSRSLSERMRGYPPGSIPYEVARQNLSAWQHNYLMATSYLDLSDKIGYLQASYQLLKGEKDALLDEIVSSKAAAEASQREAEERQERIRVVEHERDVARQEADEGVTAANILIETKDDEISFLKEKLNGLMTFDEFAKLMRESPDYRAYLKGIRRATLQECLDKLVNANLLGEEFRDLSFYADAVDSSDSASDAGSRDA